MQHKLSPSTIAIEIQFRHMPKLEALRRIAIQHLDAFEPFATRGSRCEIVFDQSHSSKHGEVYQVAIRLHIPGQPLYVTHHSEFGGSKELLFAALNDAFRDIRRQMLKNRARKHTHRHMAA